MTLPDLPRPEYPRPNFERAEWLNLNGEWEFKFDDEDVGLKEKWHNENKIFSKNIIVPFAFQSKLSGIGDTSFHDIIWYRKKFSLPAQMADKNIILHFGAVDYRADVWVNGHHAVIHEGGFTPFEANITDFLKTQENVLIVRAQDFSEDVTLPRGKQYWMEKPESIWYTNTTGIWQTVWLEAVNKTYLEKIKITPYIDTEEVEFKFYIKDFNKIENLHIKILVTFNGELLLEDLYRVKGAEEARRIKLNEFNEHHLSRLWTPETPNLHDVYVTLISRGTVIDEVKSYFGMRKISITDGKIFLNNRPYYMKLVLDQSYYPEGILTAPSDEAIKRDIKLAKDLGFNGVRMHQKVEDPRFLHWCDKMGLLVWGEMANAFEFSQECVKRLTKEWQEMIERDYNHPCIIVWVPINESWGVPKILNDHNQQHFALSMYYLTKALDETRLVVSNDGWELVETDLCTIHDYEFRSEILKGRYSSTESAINSLPAGRKIYCTGFEYTSEPILVTEFGGISFNKSNEEGWGYSNAVNDEDFIKRYEAVVSAILDSHVIQGFCYTQLTDVEQEKNGLLTYDRIPKVDVNIIREVNRS